MARNDKQRQTLLEILERRAEVGNRFTNLKRLTGGSTGHFSALLSAEDDVTNGPVALKFLLPSFSGGYRDDSFEREAALLAELRGEPDIIQLIAPRQDFVEVLHTQDGLEIPLTFSYYALELATTDLGTVIANSAWNSEQLLLAFRGMCRGVQRLHARSTAHRDLKPANILVLADGNIRLSDFGTARRLDGSPPLARYSGPPGDIRYSAPEMLATLHDEAPGVAFRADVFSLGAILFEMFSGTVLGARIYDAQFVSDLMQAMTHVKSGRRQEIFDRLITSIADARQLPSVVTFGATVPACLKGPIDDLVQALAHLDYRKRICDFRSIFNRVNRCLLILRNEEKYKRWVAEKRRRREAAALANARSVL